jgi:hypothetical protein
LPYGDGFDHIGQAAKTSAALSQRWQDIEQIVLVQSGKGVDLPGFKASALDEPMAKNPPYDAHFSSFSCWQVLNHARAVGELRRQSKL